MTLRSIALALAFVLTLAACGRRARLIDTPPPPDAGFSLEFVDAVVFEAAAAFPALGNRSLGGLSGLTRGADPAAMLSISDEKEAPRLVQLQVTITDHRLTIVPTGATVLDGTLTNPGGPPVIDFEGIARRDDGHWFVSSEGDGEATPRVPPTLLHFDAANALVRRLAVPDHFMPTPRGSLERGVRPNEAFEGLALSSDGTRLFVGTEGVLAQDGDPPSFTSGGLVRIVEYQRRGQSYEALREYAYPLDAVPAPPDYQDPDGSIGISELTAWPDGSLIVMERSFVRERGGAKRSRNSVRLYQTRPAGAEDTARIDSFRDSPPTGVLGKRLLVDFASFEHRLPAGLEGLENFEGLVIGPRLPDGAATLLAVSDDNFNASQRTAFVLLAVRR